MKFLAWRIKYIVHLLVIICCKYIVNFLVICCKYILHLLVIICCKYIVHLLVICCKYIVNLLVIYCKYILHLLVIICCKYIVYLLVICCKHMRNARYTQFKISSNKLRYKRNNVPQNTESDCTLKCLFTVAFRGGRCAYYEHSARAHPRGRGGSPGFSPHPRKSKFIIHKLWRHDYIKSFTWFTL